MADHHRRMVRRCCAKYSGDREDRRGDSGIETRYILRDENPELMDKVLTNGARSIPKLIAIDRKTENILGTGGRVLRLLRNCLLNRNRMELKSPRS